MKNRMRSRMHLAVWAAFVVLGVLFAAAEVRADTFTPADLQMYVTAGSLNVRTGPSVQAQVRNILHRGDAVRVTGSGTEWNRIRLDGGEYYVAKRYLSETAVTQSNLRETEDAGSKGVKQTLPEGVKTRRVSVTDSMQFASCSRIRSGSAVLYENKKGAHGSIVVAVNAGHGTKGGSSVKTLSHPDGSPKVTGGTNANGAVYSTAISYGMSFLDGTAEHTVTLREAKLLRDELLSRGYSVLMLREESDVQLDNIARTILANTFAACHVAIHWDATGSDKGAFFMSVPDALKTMEPVASVWKRSEALGDSLIKGLRERGVKIFGDGRMAMDLTQTSYSTVPSVDIELGDKASNYDSATLRLLAKGLADGIERYVLP